MTSLHQTKRVLLHFPTDFGQPQAPEGLKAVQNPKTLAAPLGLALQGSDRALAQHLAHEDHKTSHRGLRH